MLLGSMGEVHGISMMRGRPGTVWDPAGALQLIRLLPLMEMTAGSPEISIALIDGPIAVGHPDLAIENIRPVFKDTGVCAIPRSDACGHGTLVAGVLHANRSSAVRGICPECTLLVRSIFEESSMSDINAGPKTTVPAVADAILEVIDSGAHIINLSVGVAGSPVGNDDSIDRVLDLAVRQGVIVVAAAGNEAEFGSSAITRHPWVIPAVPCDDRGVVLPFSNIGPSIGRHGLLAPGKDILSIAAAGGNTTFTGSSAAVPFIVGTIALLWSLFPVATATQIRLAVCGEPRRRHSVTPPLLDASGAHQLLSSMIMERIPL
jgi:subtilisin family serine protease